MKNSLYALVVFFLLISCSKGNKIENQLYEQTVAEYKKEGVDLEPLLDKIEAQFIKEGVLTGKGGLAKVKYYERLAAGKEMKGLNNFEVIQPVLGHPLNSGFLSRAQKSVMLNDSLAYINSDFYLKWQRVQIGAVENGSISPKTVAQAILKEFSTEDFEHPFYRMFMLLTAAWIMEKDTEYTQKIPKRPEREHLVYNSEKTIDIRLNEDGMLLNGEKHAIEDFKKVFYAAYDAIGFEAEINFYVSPMSPYGDYASVQSVIESYMYDVRNKEAQHSFHKAYEALSDSQKQQVNEAHPLRMIEIPNK
jgi:hypothetical protein